MSILIINYTILLILNKLNHSFEQKSNPMISKIMDEKIINPPDQYNLFSTEEKGIHLNSKVNNEQIISDEKDSLKYRIRNIVNKNTKTMKENNEEDILDRRKRDKMLNIENALRDNNGNEKLNYIFHEDNLSKFNSDESDDEVTVENYQESIKSEEDGFPSSLPAPLPVSDKLISPKDLIDIIGKGLDAAKIVSNLVSTGFKPLINRNNSPSQPEGPRRTEEVNKSKKNEDTNPLFSTLAGFFKIIGIDREKLPNLAINSLVVLVHLVINNLLEKQRGKDFGESENFPEGTIYSWIFQSTPPQLKNLLEEIQEPGVEERIIRLVRENSDMETDCVQLLLCRLAPIIWGMQRALTQPPPANWNQMKPIDRMYAYFPSFHEIVQHRPRCEIRFPNCRIKFKHLYEDLEAKLMAS